MKKKRFYIMGFFIILGALAYLMTTSFQSSLQYYVTVNEALAAKADFKDKILKVAGKASQIERVEEAGRSVYRFQVVEDKSAIPVVYPGFVPDTFKEGADVVVTGSLADNGEFKATHILAKCASKYQAKIENGESIQ